MWKELTHQSVRAAAADGPAWRHLLFPRLQRSVLGEDGYAALERRLERHFGASRGRALSQQRSRRQCPTLTPHQACPRQPEPLVFPLYNQALR